MLATYHGEELQVAKYNLGGFYDFHHDTDDKMATVITFLVYLNDVDSGGETIFPFIANPNFSHAAQGEQDKLLPPPLDPRHPARVAPLHPYCQSDRFLKVRPRRGDAIVLHNIAPSLGTPAF